MCVDEAFPWVAEYQVWLRGVGGQGEVAAAGKMARPDWRDFCDVVIATSFFWLTDKQYSD